jgi:integrase
LAPTSAEWVLPRRSGRTRLRCGTAAQHKAQAITLSDYAGKWIEQRNLKPGTAIEYRRTKVRLIDPTIGKLPLRAVTADAVRSWHHGLGTDAPRRNSHACAMLHAIVKTAVTDGLLPANPCSIPKAMNTATVRQPIILTVEQLAAVADAIKPEQLRALVLVSAWCGLRWGEVIELRRKDVDEMIEEARSPVPPRRSVDRLCLLERFDLDRDGHLFADHNTTGFQWHVDVDPEVIAVQHH